MTPQCKGFCKDYPHTERVRYADGHKRCSSCCVAFKELPDKVQNCPCCHCRLKTHPKLSFYKQQLRLGKAEVQLVKA